MMKKIKILIVDDSKTVQQILTAIFAEDPLLEVVGYAENPNIARQMIKQLNPDVLTLDVEMPEMDGVTFIEKLMRLHPMPVIMCSSITRRGCDVTVAALQLGALDFVHKPQDFDGWSNIKNEIIKKVKDAARSKIKSYVNEYSVAPSKPPTNEYDPRELLKYTILLGASTGGIEALSILLKGLPFNMPPILVTQHLPSGFSASFADRVNKISEFKAAEAKQGEVLQVGHVYIAPGKQHIVLSKSANGFCISLDGSAPVSGHQPSVDVMFNSAAEINPERSIAALCTGMGSDGAAGLLNLRNKGGVTIAQDENTSVVWGMPKAAVEINAAQHIMPIDKIAEKIMQSLHVLYTKNRK